jgi:PAS domain S-box-containing protein
MQASAVESGQLAGDLKLVRKPWYDPRPVFLASSYFVLCLALDYGMAMLEPSAAWDHSHLPAALSLSLLLAYGLKYSPVVLTAYLVDRLWLHPLPVSFANVALESLCMTLILSGAAAVVRRSVPGPYVRLKHSREVMRFLGASGVAAVGLAATAAASSWLGSHVPWQQLVLDFQRDVIGFGSGIIALAPFLLIHAVPRFEIVLLGLGGERPAPNQYLQTLRVSRPTPLSALYFLASLTLVFWLILGMQVSGELSILLLLSLPLLWIALKHGLEGVSVAVPAVIFITILVLWRLGRGAEAASMFQVVLLVASLNAILIGTSVTQMRFTNRQIDRRDAILEAVSYAAQQFLGKSGWQAGVQEVMRRLGEATSVTRVFITDRRTAEKGGHGGETWLYEWTTPGLSADENDLRVLNLLRGQMIEDQASALSMGQPCLARTREIDRKKREMLEALGVRSMVIVPLFMDRQWWGCLGLEQCFIDRDWPYSEIEGLKIAGQILGTLIASVRVEQQFRQLTGNIQAVFWISPPDGQSKQYVSPGYEEIWGRSCTNLQREPGSWLDAVHHEDQARVRESLVKQVWGEYDEEYRVVRPDGSLRWVRDRAFPVRDQTGQVYRVVGIAEDITKQKKAEEELRAATVLMSSLIDNLQSGVLVEDEARRITHVNQAFSSMFGIPVPPQSLFGVDSRLLFVQPLQFAERIEVIIRKGIAVLGEELHWQERVFIRNYLPLRISENVLYHLWQYQDITVSRRAQEQIKSSLNEKEVLLKEIHHRVKNNLQIICSLLSLQAAEIEDPKASQTFKESQDRVKAMALIHERLYQSRDLASIDFAGYVRNLTGHLLRSYKVNSSAVRLDLKVDSVPMNLDVAIPCGLVINELVSNALKYAFPEGRSGEIVVRFCEENGQGLALTVRDNGVGFPSDSDPEESESLGLKLVRSLTDQLGGSVAYCSKGGFQCDIRIPRGRS